MKFRKISGAFMLSLGVLTGAMLFGCGECAHEFGEWQITSPASCKATGIRKRTCLKCKKEEIDILDQTDHVWDQGVVTIPPACETEGERTYTCMYDSSHTKTEPIDPLEHIFDTKFTVDREPTSTREGEKSRHCTRPGCTARTDEQAIPIPEYDSADDSEGVQEEKIHYRIKINRLNGTSIGSDPSIRIFNRSGEKVFEGVVPKAPGVKDEDKEYSMRDVSLPIGSYKVEIFSLPEGFECETFYEISEKDGLAPYDTPEKYPTLDIRLDSHFVKGSLGEIGRGVVLPDFEINSVNLGKTSLGELLEKKPVVMLSFYYNNCTPCRNEAPDLIKFYQKCKQDVAIVCFNIMDSRDQIMSGNDSYFHYPTDEFYFVEDQSRFFYNKLAGSGVPTTAFVDRGGFCFKLLAGAGSPEYLEELVTSNIFEREKDKTLSPLPALLPETKRHIS